MARQVLLFIWFLSLSSALGQVSYSIPEEMAKGSLVGNIAQDLGLDLKRLKSGKARIYTGDSAEYIELNKERGVLLIKERIDRETLCGQTTPCALHFQIILENPIEFYHVAVEVTDINDNAPYFKKTEAYFEISESAVNGAKFYIEQALDPDVGSNDIQSYTLSSNEHFTLKLQSQTDGKQIVEMLLKHPLDREKQEDIALVLTAVDGGDPQLSGTSQIILKYLMLMTMHQFSLTRYTKPLSSRIRRKGPLSLELKPLMRIRPRTPKWFIQSLMFTTMYLKCLK